MNNSITNKLIDITGKERVKEHVNMSAHTSFRAGGEAAVLVEPADAEQLKAVLALLSDEDCKHFILGNGSNVLFKDTGYDGVVVKIGKDFDYVRIEGNSLICGSGTLMSVVAKEALANGLTGFEFASGIPGSIGGAVFMNAGAYGGELVDILQKAHLVSADGRADFWKNASELEMGYRHSLLHETGDVVTEVVIQLEEGDCEAIKARMQELMHKRNSKQPVQYPSAGSTFKRPEGYFAGKLIQDAGLKGLAVGGAQVSELHSGFVINRDNATATDILQLMEIVQAKVLNDFGVHLEPEVRIIGE